MRARHADRGFTLVEMLAVLAIVGVSVGATMLGLGVATRRASTEAEARRLAARIRLAADDAMVTGQPIAFAWNGARYAFTGATLDGASFAPHALPAGMRLDLGRAAGSIPLGADGAGGAIEARLSGAADSWIVRYDGLNVVAAPAAS